MVDETEDDTFTIDVLEEGDIVESEHVDFAVKLTDVSRIYTIGDHSITALKDVNLEVRPSELIVIQGPSGSGKTTLLNIIGAIDYPTKGRIIVMDVPIGDYDESFRATFRLTNTGFIFQSYNLVSTLTALENIMFPMQLLDISQEEVQERALNLLEQVGLLDRKDHLPWQLSSGEQQRVAIARAMANDPPIILADEPTANLDEENARLVRDLLKHLNESGKTVIVMTHDEKIIGIKNARLFKMQNGRLSELG